MTTAFQPNAFQNNAFQIDSPFFFLGGGFRHQKKEKKQVKQLVKTYEALARAFPDAGELISATDAFVSPVNEVEHKRRQQARYLSDQTLALERIEWFALVRHQAALERFNLIATRLLLGLEKKRLREREDDDDLVLLLLLH